MSMPTDSVTQAMTRLSAEFADLVHPTTVRRAVQTSRLDLAGSPTAALPELVERLARVRIVEAGLRAGDPRLEHSARGLGFPDRGDERERSSITE
jgi:hypothetical protein